jgi:hypothetical protein
VAELICGFHPTKSICFAFRAVAALLRSVNFGFDASGALFDRPNQRALGARKLRL